MACPWRSRQRQIVAGLRSRYGDVREGSAGLSTGYNSLYVDGDLVGKAAVTYSDGFDSTVPINIGYYDAGNPVTDTQFHLTGTVDEVALYTVALTATEIWAHYLNANVGSGYCDLQNAMITALTPTTLEDAALGFLYDEPLLAAGNPLPDFEEGPSSDFPVGMDISADEKNIEWMPNDDYLGPQTFDVRAKNTGGSDNDDYSINIDDLCQLNDPMISYLELEEDVLCCLREPSLEHDQFSRVICSLVSDKYHLGDPSQAIDIDEFSQDEFVIRTLTQVNIRHFPLEQLLIEIRRELLLSCLE